jgi:eukaryotic-like serine/threonine-protein kinase
MVGQTIGKYRVVSRLGRGGMGTVYKAVDATLEREVAIKCLNPGLGDTEILKRFRAEAITLARLNHPSIATLFELTEHEGDLLMVMELVRGETFENLSHRSGPLPVDRAAQLCSQVLDALAHAHGVGVVHRDLKPANLMLTESGLTKVMDFGLARMAGTEHLTNDGFMIGTPAYMAPEQVLAHEIDGRADLYAMGVVLFRLLTAQLPFKAESGIAMVQKQLHDQPTPARQLRQELPAACDEILARALAKAPHDRFQTAEDFRAALVALGAPLSGIAASSASAASMKAAVVPGGGEPAMPATPSPVVSLKPSPAPPPVPSPRPVPSHEESAPTLVIPVPRRSNVAATAAIGAVLLAGVPTAFVLWRGRTPAVAPAAITTAAVGTAPSPRPAAAVPFATATTAASAATASGIAPAKKGPAADDLSAPAPGSPPAAASLPIVTFAKIRLLVADGNKPRDRDTSLRLGADRLDVMDGPATVQRVAYREVIGVFHSHSREPRWETPGGTVVAVAKTGGKFGFLKGTPDWITVRTRHTFIPLRVDDNDVKRVIAELESRTGTRVVRTR